MSDEDAEVCEEERSFLHKPIILLKKQTKTPNFVKITSIQPPLSSRIKQKNIKIRNKGSYSARKQQEYLDKIENFMNPSIKIRVKPKEFDKELKIIDNLEKKSKIFKENMMIQSLKGYFYIFGEVIGQGSFGIVIQGSCMNDITQYAIKIIENKRISTKRELRRLQNEIESLQIIHHEGIVKFYEYIQYKKHVYLIFERLDRELFEYIREKGRLDFDEIQSFLSQLMYAVSFLHDQSIVHRDIKPENIMLKDKTVKLCDFSFCARIDRQGLMTSGRGRRKSITFLYTYCGSPHYAAPEILAGIPYDGTRSDIWALGIVLFVMSCGYLPFEKLELTKLYETIMCVKYDIPIFVDARIADFIVKTLQFRPEDRFYFPDNFSHPAAANSIVK